MLPSAVVAATYIELLLVGFLAQPFVDGGRMNMKTTEEQFFESRHVETATCRAYVIPAPQRSWCDELEAPDQAVVRMKSSLESNLLASCGFREVDGRNWMLPRSVGRILRSIKSRARPWEQPAIGGLELLSVRYLVSPEDLPIAARPIFQGRIRIYEIGSADPLARIVSAGDGVLQVHAARPGYWKLGVRAYRPLTVVVGETMMKGWRLKGDPRAELRPMYDALIGIEMEAGVHELELEYDPSEATVGFVVGIVSLICLAFIALVVCCLSNRQLRVR
jgi:hypothetical protein